jgi:hypothetical protein
VLVLVSVSAVCCMPYAVHCMPYTVYRIPYAVCGMTHDVCHMYPHSAPLSLAPCRPSPPPLPTISSRSPGNRFAQEPHRCERPRVQEPTAQTRPATAAERGCAPSLTQRPHGQQRRALIEPSEREKQLRQKVLPRRRTTRARRRWGGGRCTARRRKPSRQHAGI